MRVSDDRFDRNRWDTFLYTSRLASAVGVWPWADVFMSTRTRQPAAGDAVGGVVGVGDALGAVNADNVRRVMRADAVLIKPDVPLVPTDESIVAEAQAHQVAHGGLDVYRPRSVETLYVFAYARDGAPQSVAFSPARLGVAGATYVYDVFGDTGRVLNARRLVHDHGRRAARTSSRRPLARRASPSWATRERSCRSGKKRISDWSDDGTVHATVSSQAGEQAVTLHGYAPSAASRRRAGRLRRQRDLRPDAGSISARRRAR